MEIFTSNIKKFQETETPKEIPYISENGNPETETLKNFLYFSK